jgi:hypothetical protein
VYVRSAFGKHLDYMRACHCDNERLDIGYAGTVQVRRKEKCACRCVDKDRLLIQKPMLHDIASGMKRARILQLLVSNDGHAGCMGCYCQQVFAQAVHHLGTVKYGWHVSYGEHNDSQRCCDYWNRGIQVLSITPCIEQHQAHDCSVHLGSFSVNLFTHAPEKARGAIKSQACAHSRGGV